MRVADGRLRAWAPTLGALLLAFVATGVVIAVTGGQPLAAFAALLRGAVGDVPAFVQNLVVNHQLKVPNEALRTLAKATPLLFSGLAVALALRAGMFNIGAEGQLQVGALASAYAGYALHGLPLFVHLPLALAVGAVVGGVWGFVPGVLKAWRGTHEVIVTIMMNYVAIQLTHYLVNGPLHDPTSQAPNTPVVQASAQIWSLPGGTNFSAGIVLALFAAIAYAIVLRRTALGYEIRAVGLGADAARAAGISVGRTQVIAMSLSGALAGLAGGVEVLAVHHRFLGGFSPGYGFDSIAVALLGGLNALGVTLSALLFGGLNSGAVQMELWTSTPRQIAGLVPALIILAVGVRYVSRKRRTAE